MKKRKSLQDILIEGHKSLLKVLENKEIKNVLDFIKNLKEIIQYHENGLIPNLVVKLEKQKEFQISSNLLELEIVIPQNITISSEPKTVKELKGFLNQIINFLSENPSHFPIFKEIQENFRNLQKTLKFKRRKIKELENFLKKKGNTLYKGSNIVDFLHFLDKNLELLIIINYNFTPKEISKEIILDNQGSFFLKIGENIIPLSVITFKGLHLMNHQSFTLKNRISIAELKTLITNQLFKEYSRQLTTLLKDLGFIRISLKEIVKAIYLDISKIPSAEAEIDKIINKVKIFNKLILLFETLKLVKDFDFQDKINITYSSPDPNPEYDYFNRDILNRNLKNYASLKLTITNSSQTQILEFLHTPILGYNEIIKISESIIDELFQVKELLKKEPADEEVPKLIKTLKEKRQDLLQLTASLDRKLE